MTLQFLQVFTNYKAKSLIKLNKKKRKITNKITTIIQFSFRFFLIEFFVLIGFVNNVDK